MIFVNWTGSLPHKFHHSDSVKITKFINWLITNASNVSQRYISLITTLHIDCDFHVDYRTEIIMFMTAMINQFYIKSLRLFPLNLCAYKFMSISLPQAYTFIFNGLIFWLVCQINLS